MFSVCNESVFDVMCSYVILYKHIVPVSCDKIVCEVVANEILNGYLKHIGYVHTVYFIGS